MVKTIHEITRNYLRQPFLTATKHYRKSKFSVMLLTSQTAVALNVRADLSSYAMIAKTIDSGWSKIPSLERPTWAKSQEEKLENKAPILTDVKHRGSRAYTRLISANQALEIKRALPTPNSA